VNPDLLVMFDAGCSSNPGRLAVAVVVCSPGYEVLFEGARLAGEGTSNVGEYRALETAIGVATTAGARRPAFLSDSMLVVQQVNGFWAVRGDPGSPLQRSHAHCTSALMAFDRWTLKHVPREQNKRADWLVSRALGHKRTLKSPPALTAVDAGGEGRPGWTHVPPSRRESK
jgi:ribonuclease HI